MILALNMFVGKLRCPPPKGSDFFFTFVINLYKDKKIDLHIELI